MASPVMETGFTKGNVASFQWPTEDRTELPAPGSKEARVVTAMALLREFFRARPTASVISAFRDADTFGKGCLGFQEFKRAIRALNIDAADDDLQDIFNLFDRSREGQVRQADFILVMLEEGEANGRFTQVGIGKTTLSVNKDPPSVNGVTPSKTSGYTNGWSRGWAPLPKEQLMREQLQSSSQIGMHAQRVMNIDAMAMTASEAFKAR